LLSDAASWQQGQSQRRHCADAENSTSIHDVSPCCARTTYCFSKTTTLLICCPFSSTPVVVLVRDLLSAESTIVSVWTTFPAFVRVSSNVEALTCQLVPNLIPVGSG
jgi:hypothetical protein